MTSAGRPPPWLARAAVVALLAAAVLPLLVLALSSVETDAGPGGPALAALSSALEKAHRCLQGDGRTALDPVAPSVAPCAHAASAPVPVTLPSPAPAAPWTPVDASAGAVESARLL